MGQNATWEVSVKRALPIVGQTFGVGLVVERGEQGLQGFRNDVGEHRAAGSPRCVGGNGWRHTSPHGQQGMERRARSCPPIYCSQVQNTSQKLTRECRGNMRDASPCRAAAVAKSALEFLYTEWTLISMIEASPHDAGSAYLAATRYKLDDNRPMLCKTNDYGRTWLDISTGTRSV